MSAMQEAMKDPAMMQQMAEMQAAMQNQDLQAKMATLKAGCPATDHVLMTHPSRPTSQYCQPHI